MKRTSTMPMHAEAHVLTRALQANVCAWPVDHASIGNPSSAFGTAKAYGTRRFGSLST